MAPVMARPRSAHRPALLAVVLATVGGGCSLLNPTSPPGTVVEGAWTQVAEAPAALTEVAAAVLDDRIWVAGGLTAEGAGSADVFVYEPIEVSWSPGPDLPTPVHHSSLVSDGTSLWLVGGYAGNGFDAPTAEVWRLEPSAPDGWVAEEPLPESRGAGAAAWDGSRIVYAGGVGPDGVSGAVFALEDGAWSQVARLATPREHLAATTDGDGSVFVLGGRVGGLDANIATADQVQGDTATEIGELPTRRGGVAAFWSPAVGACLVGGESPGGTNAQVECIDVDGDVSVLPALGRPRHGLGAAVVNRVAYVLLGGDQPGLFVSPTVEALDLR
jgi:non-specific serine/threonine protein kinase